jgi:aminoglycoside phosphotransferase (APT) family kinase protein
VGGPAAWFHGDVSPSNLLVSQGRLSAAIDFGIAGVGDPACDTAITWTFFTGKAAGCTRNASRRCHLDPRLRLGILESFHHARSRPLDRGAEADRARDVIRAVLAEHSLFA